MKLSLPHMIVPVLGCLGFACGQSHRSKRSPISPCKNILISIALSFVSTAGVIAGSPNDYQMNASPVSQKPGIWPIVRTSDSLEKVRAVAEAPITSGIVFYTSLRAIEPFENQFEWGQLDQVLAICRESGKPLKLAILGGRWVPPWLYEKGATRFTWLHDTPYVEAGKNEASASIPWDPVYLDAMQAAIEAAAIRYANDPAIVEVQVTGPALANGLEMNLSITPDQGRSIGYSREKLVAAWKRMIDVCAEAFPKQHLSLALHNDILGTRTADVAIEVRNYGLQQYPSRFNLLVCYATNEPWFNKGNTAVDMWADASPSAVKEAQLIDLYSAKNAPLENVAEAVRRASMLGASKIEVFADDIYSPIYREGIESAVRSISSEDKENSQDNTVPTKNTKP